MRIGILILALTLALPLAAQEKVYKKVNPDGTVEYSDKPIPGGELMSVPKGTVVTLPKPADFKAAETTADRKAAEKQRAEEHAAAYTRFEIVRPKDDEAIRRGSGSLTLIMRNVDRGTHTLQAEIVDSQGKVVKSTPVITFHLLRYAGGPVTFGN